MYHLAVADHSKIVTQSSRYCDLQENANAPCQSKWREMTVKLQIFVHKVKMKCKAKKRCGNGKGYAECTYSKEFCLENHMVLNPRFKQEKGRFQMYFAEYVFKHVTRKSDVVHNFLSAISLLYPPTQ